MQNIPLRIAVLFAVGLIAGCGSDNNGTPVVTDNASKAIVAANGGNVTTTQGTVSITIPPNALNADTTITITPIANPPASARLVAGTAFDFGPNGTQFNTPVTVTIKYDPAKIPAGALETKLSVYKVVNGVYVEVQANGQPAGVVNTANHTITVPLSSFSIYAVLANNQFAGTYAGTYQESNNLFTGPWQATVDVNGVLNATATPGFVGQGTVAFNGTANVPLNGTGLVGTHTITFAGAFALQQDGSVNAQGTWNSDSGLHGTWVGTRTGP